MFTGKSSKRRVRSIYLLCIILLFSFNGIGCWRNDDPEKTLATIEVTPTSSSIVNGTTLKFTATGIYTDDSNSDITEEVTWSSSDDTVAMISNVKGDRGLASGVGAGITTITAVSGEISGNTELTVEEEVLISIEVTPVMQSIAKGSVLQYIATGTFSNYLSQNLTEQVVWSSSDETVSVISNDIGSQGRADGIGVGSSTITATFDGVDGTTQITVTPAVLVGIEVTPPASSISAGLTKQFTAVGIYSDMSTQDITGSVMWDSSNPGIAGISSDAGTNGLATGVSSGSTTITAFMDGGINGSVVLTVTDAELVSIEVTPQNSSLALGFSQQFMATGIYTDNSTQDITASVTWSSSDPVIATISNAAGSKGAASGLSEGFTVITAVLDGVSADSTLDVKDERLISIDVTPSNPGIAYNSTLQLAATGTYADGTTKDITGSVTWISENSQAVTVSNVNGTRGVVTGISAGSAVITATIDDISGLTIVSVAEPELISINVTPANPQIALGLTRQFTATGVYADSSSHDLTGVVTWNSSNNGVAVISNAPGTKGLASGMSVGTVTVTAMIDGDMGSTSLVISDAELVSIDITPVNPAITVGTNQQYTATGTYTDNSTQDITGSVTWSSSANDVAVISNAAGSKGLASSVSDGITDITAVMNGVSATTSLTVTAAELLSIEISPVNSSMALGLDKQYTAIGTYSDSSTQNLTGSVTWSSSDNGVATISNAGGSNGLASSLSVGSTSITAALNGKSASTNLTVSGAELIAIELTPANPIIALGLNQQFTATGSYTDNSTQDLTGAVTWSSSNIGVAVISNASGSNGLTSSVSAGTTTVTAELDGESGSTVLSVTDAELVSIGLTPVNPSIANGHSRQFTATGTYTDSSTQNITGSVTWSSSNNSVASVSNAAGSNGLASSVSVGSVTVSAVLNGVSASTMLTVTDAELVSIEVTPANPSIARGLNQQLTATGTYTDNSTQDVTGSVTWSSSNEGVASISNVAGSNGLASSISSGTTTISAALDGKTGNTLLTVTGAALVSIDITPVNPAISLGTDQQYTATGTYTDSSTQNITGSVNWSSSANSVAVISNAAGSNGLASSVADGVTTISATLNDVSGTTSLTVTGAELVSIEISPVNSSIALGLNQQYTAIGTYTDNSTQNITGSVTWSSSDNGVASISNAGGSNGLLSSLSEGSTTISATRDGKSISTNLSVSGAELVAVELAPVNPIIASGLNQQFNATGIYTDDSTQDITGAVTWSSSNVSIAVISNAAGSNGLVTSVSAGTTTIRATLDGESGSTTLNVTDAELVSIGVTPANPSIALGLSRQFIATGTYTDNSTRNITESVTWSSSDINVSTISNAAGSNGLAVSVSVGNITVSAIMDGIAASTTLTITDAELISIEVTPTNSSIAQGLNQQFTATGAYTDNSTQDLTGSVTWSSSNAGVASISNVAGNNGFASSNSTGETTISATFDGESGNTLLTVTGAELVSIDITPLSSSIALGFNQQFNATGIYTDNSTQNITGSVLWSSSNNSVSTISNAAGSKGLASSVSDGVTEITAILNGVSSTTSFTVTGAELLSIEISPANSSITLGLNRQFTAIGSYSDSSTQNISESVTWSSSNIGVATISNAGGSNGLASSQSPGNTTISAVLNGISSSTGLSVSGAELVTIELTPVNPSVASGLNQQFTATGIYTDNSTQDITGSVTWSSSNISIAVISNASGSNGLASSVSEGAATITASLDGKSGSTVLSVTDAELVSIELTPVASTIAMGQSQQFTATGIYTDDSTRNITENVTWISSDPDVSTVSNVAGSKGLASGVSEGSITVSAALDGVTASTTFSVTDAELVSIEVTPANPSIAKGMNRQFTAMGTYTDNSTQDLTGSVTWSSSNNGVASISNAAGNNGLASGVSEGTTTISAALDGETGSTQLAVTGAALVSIDITPATSSIALGYTRQFNATGTYTDSSTQNITGSVTWSSSANGVAVVSNAVGSKGLATTVSDGVANITATLSGVSGTTSFTVTEAELVSIEISPVNSSVALGLNRQYTAIGTYTNSSTQNITGSVTWSSSDNGVANISNAAGSKGLASSLSVGSTTISATYDGISSSTSLSISGAELVSINLTPANPMIALGLNQQLTATGTYTDDSVQDITGAVTWSSSNMGVAVISNASGSNGLASSVSAGSTTITATLDGESGSTSLSVTGAELVSIGLTPVNTSIALGHSRQFAATGIYTDGSNQDITGSVTWSSSNIGVASVSNAAGSEGLAVSASVGNITVSAVLDGVSASTALTVTDAELISIDVTPVNPSISLGLSRQFVATGTYTDSSTQNLTGSVTWSSSANGIAVVSNVSGSNGLASSVSVGTATITATLDGESGSTALSITDAELVSIGLTPVNPSIVLGSNQQFTATGAYTDNSTQNITGSVTWSSSANGVAVVSNAAGSNGLATSVSDGAATITAVLSGVTGTTSLTVTEAELVSIEISPLSSSIAMGLNKQYTAIGSYTDSSTQNITESVTWSSSSNSVASISNAVGSKGLAVSVANGSVTIAAVLDGVTGNASLTVTAAELVSIALSPLSPSIALGLNQQFNATGTYTDSKTQNITGSVTWSSSNNSVASISNAVGSNGLATSLSTGNLSITAVMDGVSRSTALTVTGALLVSIDVTPVSASVARGLDQQYSATGTYTDSSTQDITGAVTWISSSIGIAAISNASGSKGLATGVEEGGTTISATLDGVSGDADLTVTGALLLSIDITPVNPSVSAGNSQQFAAVGNYTDGSTLDVTAAATWSSSNGSVASISNASGSEGLAECIAEGIAEITASYSGVVDITDITVTPAVSPKPVLTDELVFAASSGSVTVTAWSLNPVAGYGSFTLSNVSVNSLVISPVGITAGNFRVPGTLEVSGTYFKATVDSTGETIELYVGLDQAEIDRLESQYLGNHLSASNIEIWVIKGTAPSAVITNVVADSCPGTFQVSMPLADEVRDLSLDGPMSSSCGLNSTRVTIGDDAIADDVVLSFVDGPKTWAVNAQSLGLVDAVLFTSQINTRARYCVFPPTILTLDISGDESVGSSFSCARLFDAEFSVYNMSAQTFTATNAEFVSPMAP